MSYLHGMLVNKDIEAMEICAISGLLLEKEFSDYENLWHRYGFKF